MMKLYKQLYGKYPKNVTTILDKKLSENSDINLSVADDKILGKFDMKF